MARLAVTVRMHGNVVDEGVFEVKKKLALGEARQARIPFPGAEVHAEARGGAIWVRGVELRERDQLKIGLLDVEVVLHHLPTMERTRKWARLDLDRRFGAAVMVVLLCGLWIEAVRSLQALKPIEGSTSAEEWRPGLVAQGAEARISVPEELDRTGTVDADEYRRADDQRSGVGWSEWAFADPSTRGESFVSASPALQLYLAGDFSGALEGIEALEGPVDPVTHARVLMRLDRLSEAQGMLLSHTGASPHDSSAQLQLRDLMDRMGQLDSPQRAELAMPASPTEHMLVSAMMAARRGQDDAALAELDQLFSTWDELDDDARQEIRISLAVDPTFASMRGHPGVISMLYRHLGSTAPARLR